MAAAGSRTKVKICESREELRINLPPLWGKAVPSRTTSFIVGLGTPAGGGHCEVLAAKKVILISKERIGREGQWVDPGSGLVTWEGSNRHGIVVGLDTLGRTMGGYR